MNYERFFGILCSIFSFCGVFFGVPSQIFANYKEKKCGMALAFVIIMLGLLSSRVAYGIVKGAYYIVVPDALGFFLFIVILWQYLEYRRQS